MPIRVWDFVENKAKTVPDAEAEAGIAAGRYGMRKGVDISVTSPDGQTTGVIPSDKTQEYFQTGWKLSQPKSSEQIKQETQAEVASDMEGTAFLKNAMSAATFGASDLAARAAGIEPEFAQQVEEQNPVASTAGTVTGALASGFMLPGKAVTTAAEQIGSRVAAQTGSKVIGTAANYAADGLAYGFGSAVSEAALGDPNEIANEIILGGGLGAGMGAFVGSVSPIAKAVSSKLLDMSEKAITKSAEATLGKAAVKSTEKEFGTEAAQKLESMITTKTEDGTSLLAETFSPKTRAEIKKVSEEAADFTAKAKVENAALKQEIRDSVNEAKNVLNFKKGETQKALKTALDEAAIKAEQTPYEAAQIFEDVASTVRTQADIEYGAAMEKMKLGLEAKPLSYSDEEKLANLYDNLTLSAQQLIDNPKYSTKAGNSIGSIVDSFATASNSVDRMSYLHDLRKELGSMAYGKRMGKTDPYIDSIKNIYDDINKTIDSMENPFVKGFRDADDTYTQAYEIRQLSNKFLSRNPKKSATDNATLTAQKMLRAPGEFELLVNNLSEFTKMIDPVMKENLEKAGEMVTKAAKAGKPEAVQAQENLLASIRDKMGEIKSAKPAEIADLIISITGKDIKNNVAKQETLSNALNYIKANPSMSNIDKMVYLKKSLNPEDGDIAYLEKVAKDNQNLSFINSLKGEVPNLDVQSRVAQIGTSAATGAVLGGAGGPVGAMAHLAVTKAIDIARSPYNQAAALVAIESVAKNGRKIVEKWSNNLGSALISKPVTRAIISVKNEEENYKTRTAALQANADPFAFADNLSASLHNLGPAPQVQLALMTQIQNANNYLQSQVPRDPLEGQYLNPAFSKWKPSAQEIAKFNRKWEAVENPPKMMEKFADGTITKEEVDALKAVHPAIFQKMQKLTIQALTNMSEPVHYEKRLALGIMFEGVTDPTLQPAYINYMQTLAASVGKNQPKPKSNLKYDADVLLSDSQRLSMT